MGGILYRKRFRFAYTHTQSRNTTMDLKLFLVFMIVAVAVTSARSPYYDDYNYDLYDRPDYRYDRYDEPMRRPPPFRRMQGRYRGWLGTMAKKVAKAGWKILKSTVG